MPIWRNVEIIWQAFVILTEQLVKSRIIVVLGIFDHLFSFNLA